MVTLPLLFMKAEFLDLEQLVMQITMGSWMCLTEIIYIKITPTETAGLRLLQLELPRILMELVQE